jgi:hypothetical protein
MEANDVGVTQDMSVQWMAQGRRLRVILSKEQQEVAARAAIERHRSQRAFGRADFKTRPQDDGLVLDVQGALAEMAVSVAFNLPWDGKFLPVEKWDLWRREGHDVSGLEVKSTKHMHGRLILHETTKPDLPAVLVVVENSAHFELVGWCYARGGRFRRTGSRTVSRDRVTWFQGRVFARSRRYFICLGWWRRLQTKSLPMNWTFF